MCVCPWICLADPIIKTQLEGIPWWPSGRILLFHCRGPGCIPDQGTRIPQALWCGKKRKKRKKDSWKHSTDLGSDFSKRGHIHTYITTKENIPWAECVHICASGTCTPKYTQSHTGKGRDTNQLESAETSP